MATHDRLLLTSTPDRHASGRLLHGHGVVDHSLHETHVCRDCGAEITLPYVLPDTATDLLDRLMELWQEPWSELAFGEAQMLVGRLRTVVDRAGLDEAILQALSDEQRNIVIDLLTSRRQTPSEWFADIVMDLGLGRANGREYPPAATAAAR